jgi:crotonobetainyl-CoA:carnitine CoA-transferase CaiB-like acyl-CoA transferase
MAQVQAPLTGRTLVDLSTLLPGPYAGLLLAQLGCRVVKVEPPSGDPLRQFEPGLFALVNAGKEGVTLDLKDPAGRRALGDLVRAADAVLTNALPATADRLGISPAALHADNPDAVVCRLLGREPDRAHVPSHDLDILALTGAFAFGPAAGTFPLGLPVADLAAGAMAAFALSAALTVRAPGRVLDVSMEDVLRTWVAMSGSMATVESWSAPGGGVPHLGGYGVFPAADGRDFVIAAVEDRFWTGVVKVFALDPDWAGIGHTVRRDRADELNAAVRDRALTAPAGQWVALLQAEGVPASPVRTPAEALAASDPTARCASRRPAGSACAFPPAASGSTCPLPRNPPTDWRPRCWFRP